MRSSLTNEQKADQRKRVLEAMEKRSMKAGDIVKHQHFVGDARSVQCFLWNLKSSETSCVTTARATLLAPVLNVNPESLTAPWDHPLDEALEKGFTGTLPTPREADAAPKPAETPKKKRRYKKRLPKPADVERQRQADPNDEDGDGETQAEVQEHRGKALHDWLLAHSMGATALSKELEPVDRDAQMALAADIGRWRSEESCPPAEFFHRLTAKFGGDPEPMILEYLSGEEKPKATAALVQAPAQPKSLAPQTSQQQILPEGVRIVPIHLDLIQVGDKTFLGREINLQKFLGPLVGATEQ